MRRERKKALENIVQAIDEVLESRRVEQDEKTELDKKPEGGWGENKKPCLGLWMRENVLVYYTYQEHRGGWARHRRPIQL